MGSITSNSFFSTTAGPARQIGQYVVDAPKTTTAQPPSTVFEPCIALGSLAMTGAKRIRVHTGRERLKVGILIDTRLLAEQKRIRAINNETRRVEGSGGDLTNTSFNANAFCL